jgi:DNA repair protein RadD
MKILRPDQTLAIDNLRELLRSTSRAIVQAPTGAGKTVMMSDMVTRARAKHKKVIVTVPAISLIDQTVQALATQGLHDEVGVIQAKHMQTDWGRPVQVCSVQTLQRRWQDGQMPEADLVLVDEVHKMFDLFSKWIPDPKWTKVPFIGFSATPWSEGLGKLYNNSLLVATSITKLIEQKTLVPFRTFAPDSPDLSGVRSTTGRDGSDFVAADLDEIMRPAKLVANIVETWKQLASGRVTVAFCCSRAHADQVAKEFNGAGIGAGYLDCESSMSERREVRKAMLRGEIMVVCNVDVIGLGVDWPEVSCIIYARPTKSDMRFVQNIGRGLRSCEGKADLLILDHSTTTQRLGFVDEIYNFHEGLSDEKIKTQAQPVVAMPKICPNCFMLKPPRTPVCPHCGHEAKVDVKPVMVKRGSLRELRPGDESYDWKAALPDKEHCYGQLWWYGHSHGYKTPYAAVKVKQIFGSFPRARQPQPDLIVEPTRELMQWILQQNNSYKKDLAKERKEEYRRDVMQRAAQRQQLSALAAEARANGHPVRQYNLDGTIKAAPMNGHGLNGHAIGNGKPAETPPPPKPPDPPPMPEPPPWDDMPPQPPPRGAVAPLSRIDSPLMSEEDWREFK